MSTNTTTLRTFRVSLHENAGDTFTVHFDCAADSTDRAEEQAEAAYPGCEIVLVTDMGDVQPNESLKTTLLKHCYTEKGVTPLSGYRYLAAKHNSTNVGIFVMTGIFGRDEFKAAVAEAKAAGLRTPRMYVYADLCTYTGPAIQFAKLDDLGLPNRS